MTTSNRFTYLVITLFMSFITACQGTPNQVLDAPPNISQNQPFTLLPVETEAEIFELNDDIKQQLTTTFPANKRNLRSTRKLLQFLLDNGDASLSYQSGATLIANQAYNDLNANCLSLSILAYSMADFLGMHSQFQQVHIPEYWALNKGYNLLTGHINLRVSPPRNSGSNISYVYTTESSLVVDFDPNSRSEKFKTSAISKARITAMFYNNKGVTAMLKKQHNTAYSYFLAATKADPLYSGAWGNLAVFLRIHNQLNNAELAYNHALAINENNNTALGNLALLYRITERHDQADKILTMLDKKRQANPYYHISLGHTAYQNKAYQDAIKHYSKAKRLDNQIHDSYFGLARTYFQLGDLKHANKQLRLANKHADFAHDKKRYQLKLKTLSNMTAKVDGY
ncbi:MULTISPECIES: hypothetical protein [unclassified Pseudoalteromonas]|uniref:tetratricopeptide repeat protein n=1 Tax=unclassified Pseudoalteromonas TaxID=194690 RepID=UPI0025B2A6DA|nr:MULTISPECIES: hypothetical protein [unclassified Pseudoalteromonas]MDN3378139.1 hypothetical protein [Pseudoalteromonas sp. APC 3893]MDN3386904.1 hypothetical protein [Pseudoalteromonas sp. APC 4017]